MGGAIAFYRHFVERDDFELFVATTDERVLDFNPSYQTLIFSHPPLLERVMNSRLSQWAHSFRHLVSGNFIPDEVISAAEEFKPDLIFTIAGSWDWTTLMSRKLAQRMNIPLVGSFNDWFDFSTIIHPLLRPALEKTFRKFYADCDLAWCTCEGMKRELGEHPNAHVLYPIGSNKSSLTESHQREQQPNNPPVVTFAGNLSLWYGRMMEELVSTALISDYPIEFRIFGGNQSWGPDFHEMVVDRDIFRGYIPFEELKGELAKSDLLILPMGCEEECALVERTSFNTKFLDYLTCKKPIVVWGPDYCSAVQVAREFDSAEVCTSPCAQECFKSIKRVLNSPSKQKNLIDNAEVMFASRFHPNKIHQGLLQKIHELVEPKNN